VARCVTEAEIAAADSFSPKGEYETALEIYQNLLARTDDPDQRFYILYQIVRNSSLLDRQEVLRTAVNELDAMSKPEFSRAIVSLDRAYAEIELKRPANALGNLCAGGWFCSEGETCDHFSRF
jgi:lipopolysaccharide biosynthesis regulator YciM